MAEFLFEIGLEEIPARMIAGAQAELERRVVGMLERERLIAAGVASKSFATPRRLAVWVDSVAERQEDVSEELVGPSVKVAYKDGVATPAALAFAKKAGVTVEALKTVTTAKGEYLGATAVKAGRGAAEVIAAEMPKELAAIYWPKNMYWRAGRPERFVRPVRWLVALLGGVAVPVSFGGYHGGALTFGHRVLFGDDAISLAAPGEYEEALLKVFVVADVEVRRQKIRKALDAVTRAGGAGLRWREDHELVETVTQLTEWPSVVMGGFEKEYLALPEEVLVTVMRDHQKYFAVEDKDGRLAPHFLAVLNTEADEDGLAVIRHGNERVLRARFNDARFFWEFDQRVPLVERVELLEHVTFQKDLGSYAAKTERVRKLADALADVVSEQGITVKRKDLAQAATLAKTDLTSELVKEFTELQGQIGGLYARSQGETEATAIAIYDHYRPIGAGDQIPSTTEGQLLSIADKADSLAGMFKLGMEPTGSKDPFALRRAANGVVQILAESNIRFGPRALIELPRLAMHRYFEDYEGKVSPEGEIAISRLQAFFVERLEFYLGETRGQAYDVVKAVLASGAEDVRDAVARAEAVTAVRGSDDFAAVSAAFKRMKNILAQAAEKGIAAGVSVDAALLTEPTEKALAEKSAELAGRVKALRGEKNYKAALEAVAALRPQVDAFFDAVMVMAPDAAVRANRLALLQKVLGDFSGIADFSEIVVAG
jgi:glycyl-tRNA synthetase beta chain